MTGLSVFVKYIFAKQVILPVTLEMLARALCLPDDVKIVDIRCVRHVAGTWELKLEGDAFPDCGHGPMPVARIDRSHVWHSCTDEKGQAEVWSKTTGTLSIP